MDAVRQIQRRSKHVAKGEGNREREKTRDRRNG